MAEPKFLLSDSLAKGEPNPNTNFKDTRIMNTGSLGSRGTL